MLRNPARERLENGELALGFGVRTVINPEIAKIAKTAGYDWLFLDIEHSAGLSWESAQQIAVTALDVGITPLAGVPQEEQDMAIRLLRGGALGTVTPHVESAADARRIIDAQLFPPLGHRGTSGLVPHFDFRPIPVEEMFRQINAATLTVVMLESQYGVDHADEIAAVEGIDVLLVGTGDLSVDLGIPGKQLDDRMRACYEKVIAAARAHGKWAGCSGLQSDEALKLYIEMGVRFVQGGNDIVFMLEAAGRRSRFMRELAIR